MWETIAFELDHHAGHAEAFAEALGHRRESGLEIGLAEKAGDLEHQRGVTSAFRGLARTVTLVRGELAGDHRGDEEQQEREPLFGIAHAERVGRVDEEPVEREERCDRRRDRRAAAESSGGTEHRQEVEHRDIRHLRACLDDADDGTDQRDCGERGRISTKWSDTPHRSEHTRLARERGLLDARHREPGRDAGEDRRVADARVRETSRQHRAEGGDRARSAGGHDLGEVGRAHGRSHEDIGDQRVGLRQ